MPPVSSRGGPPVKGRAEPGTVIRVVVAKPGLDGHDRGAKVIARSLRDAGMEVVYTGIRQTPETIVRVALEEDAQVIGLSILSGAHLLLCERIMGLLHGQGMGDIVVVVGGTVPRDDVARLLALGVAGVFGPGTAVQTIVDFIRRAVEERGVGRRR
ncbi:MAG: cobalamin B12-binding domain-containing protein [Candidatus Rokubacteria bacterium]|nr:cobalamin B12-binding domain-containing protein [Candidatus Rokubacteria bacterium]MBI3107349.1 cobalamin B12-binding domain-containing protein [Candidatus Rokubacteria bacterium]